MSPNLRNFSTIITLSLTGSSAFAQKTTPPAPTRTAPPPGLVMPIDDHIAFLILIGLVVGIFYFYKNKKKASVSSLE